MSIFKNPSPVDARRRIDWVNAVFMTVTPLLAVGLTAYYLPKYGLVWQDALVFFFMYITTGLAVTAGYHRYYSHRSYDCHWSLQVFYLLFGAAAIENSALKWCRDHRIHHQKVDTFEDPYNIQEGFFWAHMGWIYYQAPEERDYSCAPDLKRDKLILLQHRFYLPLLVLIGFGLPTALAALYGRPFAGFLFGGLVRAVFVQHMTFFINSLAHFKHAGDQPYSVENTARDSWWLAFLTYGEGFHNFHHRFGADYRNGIRWYHFDPTKWWIRSFKSLGLVTRLTRYRDDLILKAKLETDMKRVQMRLVNAPEKLSARIEARMENARKQIEAAYERWEEAKDRYKELKRSVLANSRLARAQWKLRMRQHSFQLQAAQARWALLIATFSRFHGHGPIA